MVDTATFRMFHRRPPGPETGERPEMDTGLGESLPTYPQDDRARRREARALIREAAGEPDGAGLTATVEDATEPPAPKLDADQTVEMVVPPPADEADEMRLRAPFEAENATGSFLEPELDPEPEPEPEPPLREASTSIQPDHQLLGLANPSLHTVIGRLGEASPMLLSTGGTGIYRPDGFRPGPWSGFSYETSWDDRTGLTAGTHILTARGEVAVENLELDDTALALRGPALVPITWIGRSLAAGPTVEISTAAFGPGRPRRTLCVAADHLVFIDAIPVTAGSLVNGTTICICDPAQTELFHVDIGSADVLLVEGVPLASAVR